jgi:hypothetical protein
MTAELKKGGGLPLSRKPPAATDAVSLQRPEHTHRPSCSQTPICSAFSTFDISLTPRMLSVGSIGAFNLTQLSQLEPSLPTSALHRSSCALKGSYAPETFKPLRLAQHATF